MLKPLALTVAIATMFLMPFTGSWAAPKNAAVANLNGATPPKVGRARASSPTGERQAPSSTANSTDIVTDASPHHREWELVASVDGAACRAELTALGIQFRDLPDRTAPDAQGCGIPHGVLVTKGPRGITYAPPLQIDCTLAKELPWIEDLIQTEADEHLGSPIKQIVTLGTFSCRKVRGGFTGRLSEHAVGNAIDFGGFVPKRGATVNVSRDYRPFDDAPAARGLFLRSVFHGLRAHGGLTHVIGPETRADHHDHIHVDRGEPWWHFVDRPFGG